MNSIIGAFVGDAAGATLEFYRGTITEQMATRAMNMPGGGPANVGPGQITDDGELTLALWNALNEAGTSDTPKCIATIMKHYGAWYESEPFDIGQTCSRAFENCSNIADISVANMKDYIKSINAHSEANGALMRATAIATWIATKTTNDPLYGAMLAKEDAQLSHPRVVCQEVNAIYVYAIILLLRGTSPTETLAEVDTYVNTHVTSDTVKQWYFVESLNVEDLNCQKMIGHVRLAFVLAIYFLRNPHISYEDAIKYTLMKGGDTDTNACIVGGLVAAYKPIPEYMSRPVLTFDCLTQEHRRPVDYSVKHFAKSNSTA